MSGRPNVQQSLYSPKNPQKYRGDPSKIVCRSSWERTFCRWCDITPTVVYWQSEEFCIPYFDSASGKQRRYFPDFLIGLKRNDGTIEHILIEIKPYAQTVPPKQPKRMTKKSQQRMIQETATYVTNMSKWDAAREYCHQRGYKFMIMTEKEIYGK